MKNIAAALVLAQREFGPALKSSSNPHFKSKYADLAACIEAVVDALNNNNIMMTQRTHEVESGVMVETVFIHSSGEELSSGKLHVPAAKNDPQGYGSALTYARRYSLMAACGIAPEDDDGNAATRPHSKAIDVASMVAKIAEAATLNSLKTVYAEAYRSCEGNPDALKKIEAAKNAQKAMIEAADQGAEQ
jgi:hypothetical protein